MGQPEKVTCRRKFWIHGRKKQDTLCYSKKSGLVRAQKERCKMSEITQLDMQPQRSEYPNSELYVGTKIVKAEPMTSDEFKKFKGQEIGLAT